MKQSKNHFLRIFVWSVAALFVIVGSIEIFFNLTRPSQYHLDPELGWSLKPHFLRSLTQYSLDGKAYPVTYSTDEYGLRTHGDQKIAKTKILVIGDSHTAENYVSDDQMWYSVMIDRLNTTPGLQGKDYFVWAGGGGGWGSYQELILLKRLLKQIKPDLFILQFCDNDFVNNHRQWESHSIVRSQKWRRPYMDVNGLSSFSDDWYSTLWRNAILGASRTFNFFDILAQIAQSKYYGGFGPALGGETQAKYNGESLVITQNIINAMRSELGSTPAFMVTCSANEVNDAWLKIAKNAGFIPLPQGFDVMHAHVQKDIESMIQKKPFDSKGSYLHVDGGHLNPRGNFEYGVATAKALVPYLQKIDPQ